MVDAIDALGWNQKVSIYSYDQRKTQQGSIVTLKWAHYSLILPIFKWLICVFHKSIHRIWLRDNLTDGRRYLSPSFHGARKVDKRAPEKNALRLYFTMRRVAKKPVSHPDNGRRAS